MRANESTQPNSVFSRLFGGLALVLFLAWYVLPNCHCQWNALFGEVEETKIPDSPALSSDHGNSDCPCHCEDRDTKTFHVAEGLQPTDDQREIIVFALPALPDVLLAGRLPVEVIARGPPTREFPLPSRSRTYLRHRSLLL